jgi:hypothetical protein
MRHPCSLAFLARAFGAALLLGGPLAAQATFTGVIQPASLATFCQEETHYLTCSASTPAAPTGLLLKSSTLDLSLWEGQNAVFTAVPRGVECEIWDVIDVHVPPPATLVVCGAPVPGCEMRLRVGPSGVLGQYWLYVSLAPGFVPINPVKGTLLIAEPLIFVASGSTAGLDATVDFTLPTMPLLTGLSLWFQGARRDIGPIGPVQLTNAVCLTILGPSPPCHSIDC